MAAFGGSTLALDAVSAQRVATAENEGRSRFVARVVHRQFASGTFVSWDLAFWHGHLPAECPLGTTGMQLKGPHARVAVTAARQQAGSSLCKPRVGERHRPPPNSCVVKL